MGERYQWESRDFENVSTSSHQWIGPFAARLLELRPEIALTEAVHHAAAIYQYAAMMDPCDVAEAFSLRFEDCDDKSSQDAQRGAPSATSRRKAWFSPAE
jgi:hypothetical protein